MKRWHSWLAIAAAVAMLAPIAGAAQAELRHVSTIDLSLDFNSETGYGSNPLSIAFDGTNAYIGGFNNSGATGNVGVVKVSNIFGGGAMFTPLAATLFSSPASRGLDALSYDPVTGSVLMMHDSGAAGSSFISRRDTSGANIWTILNPNASRPTAMAVDPLGNGSGSPGVGFLVQGSGRRQMLSIADGSTVFTGANGGIVNSAPTFFGTSWRSMAFDSDGNIAISEDSGFQYGTRTTANQWTALNGTADRTSNSITKDLVVNAVGQGIAILEDLGSDLLAVSGRNMTTFTDLGSAVSAVDDTKVHIRNLDGSIGSLTQILLSGDEDGIGTPWTGDIKNLAFGLNAEGDPTLLVVDFIDRRLDVYVFPEPVSGVLLTLGGLVVLRRRR